MAPSSASVLLLHGQPGSAQDWTALESAIAGRARTIAIDRPGWDGRTAPTDLAGNVRAAVGALDEAGVERATVVGHSLGGAVAAWLAAEHPERVNGLVLAAPSASCGSLNRLDELLATPILGSALTTTGFAGIGLTLELEPVRRRVMTRLALPDGYLRRYTRTFLNPMTWHSFVVEQRMLVRDLPVLEDRLPAITAPTTIVIGTADRIVSPTSARELAAQIPGAKLVALERASHLLAQQRPAELAEMIVELAADGSVDDRRASAGQDLPGSG